MAEGLPSKAQLDKLGDRLRAGSREESDFRELDGYRRSFRPAYEQVMDALAMFSRLERTGRPAKTTKAIVDKLVRQRIRLTQIQDICGVRLVCPDAPDQDLIVRVLPTVLPVAQVDDRRVRPSHGYRAVHVIVSVEDHLVEIQVRTRAQHQWAEVSEKLSDLLDPAIKYGRGPQRVSQDLLKFSETVKLCEELERQHRTFLDAADELRKRAADAATGTENAKLRNDAEELISRVQLQRRSMEDGLREITQLLLRTAKEAPNDLLD